MIKVISYIVITIFSVATSLSQIKSEEIVINNMAIQLPGTLSYSSEKTPLIIWVHGSGGVDRNGNQPKYIKQFRDEINKNEIAFFSYDKRTANKNNNRFIKEDGIYINDFISDVKEVVNHFKDDERFPEIILAGHSQGSLIAMFALDKVDKYISIAGAGETIDKTLIRQLNAQNPELSKSAILHFKQLRETGKIENINPNLISLFAKPNQPFWASWININPVEEIKKVKIPTLIINGDKDLQVLVKDAQNLKEAKSDAKLVIVKNMNHLLKNIENDDDNIKSYQFADFPISEELIKVISNFVLTSKK